MNERLSWSIDFSMMPGTVHKSARQLEADVLIRLRRCSPPWPPLLPKGSPGGLQLRGERVPIAGCFKSSRGFRATRGSSTPVGTSRCLVQCGELVL